MEKVRIKFLGVGNAFSMKFGNNSAVVAVEKNGITKNIMIDCGRTTPDDLVRAGYTWEDIDAIFITHLHGDHVYGLETAGFMGRYKYNKKPHLIFPNAKIKNDLWEKVLKGTMAQGDLDRLMNFDDYFTFDIVDKTEEYFLFNGVMFSTFVTQHVKNKKSYGLVIGEFNYVIYTSDSLLNRDFLDLAVSDGCQAIFHDCQMIHYEGQVHASLQDLRGLDSHIREKIIIMHYGDDIVSHYGTIHNCDMRIASRDVELEFDITFVSLTA